MRGRARTRPVSKEYVEVFAAGCVVQLDDFRHLTVTQGGKQKSKKAAQDKGQAHLVAAFMDAVRRGGPPPIPLAEIAAVTEATFAVEEALRLGGTVVMSSNIPPKNCPT